MHVVAIIIGLLLLVFGGGCVLMFVGFRLHRPEGHAGRHSLLLTMSVPLRAACGSGWFLFRCGLKRDRKQQAEAMSRNPV